MKIDLAGFGPGSLDMVSRQVLDALSEADVIITSRRLADVLKGNITAEDQTEILVETGSKQICAILEALSCRHVLCLFGGDISFYSGAAPLLKLIGQSKSLQNKELQVRLLPGISSLSAACARLGISFQDAEVYSAHGRSCDPVRAVMNGKKSFFLTGGKSDPSALCRELTDAGLGDLQVTVCEMLCTKKERIRTMTAAEAAQQSFLPLAVLVVEPAPVSELLRRTVPGIADEEFVRGAVPMTKRLVRVCALSMLNPSSEDVCWDLGAGTGSVSVEMSARCARVIAVERNPEALHLMEENRRRFGAWNMKIVSGAIPDILPSLPVPDAVFVGGGGREIRSILNCVKELVGGPGKDPSGNTGRDVLKGTCGSERSETAVKKIQGMPKICAAAVTLETLHEVRTALEEYGYETEVVQTAVTEVKKRGHSHMMDALNPVFLISGGISREQSDSGQDMPGTE